MRAVSLAVLFVTSLALNRLPPLANVVATFVHGDLDRDGDPLVSATCG